MGEKEWSFEWLKSLTRKTTLNSKLSLKASRLAILTVTTSNLFFKQLMENLSNGETLSLQLFVLDPISNCILSVKH